MAQFGYNLAAFTLLDILKPRWLALTVSAPGTQTAPVPDQCASSQTGIARVEGFLSPHALIDVPNVSDEKIARGLIRDRLRSKRDLLARAVAAIRAACEEKIEDSPPDSDIRQDLECVQANPDCPGCEPSGDPRCSVSTVKPPIEPGKVVFVAGGYRDRRDNLFSRWRLESVIGTCTCSQACSRIIPNEPVTPGRKTGASDLFGGEKCHPAEATVLTSRIEGTSSTIRTIGCKSVAAELKKEALADAEAKLAQCLGAEQRAQSKSDFRCAPGCREKNTSCLPAGAGACSQITCARVDIIVKDIPNMTADDCQAIARDCFRTCECTKECEIIPTPSPTPKQSQAPAAPKRSDTTSSEAPTPSQTGTQSTTSSTSTTINQYNIVPRRCPGTRRFFCSRGLLPESACTMC